MSKGKKPSKKVSEITSTKKVRDVFTPGITIDMDTNMVSLSNPFLTNYLDTQKKLQKILSGFNVYQDTIKELVSAQQRAIDLATLPIRQFSEDMARIASFQQSIASQAFAMQNLVQGVVLNSGILDIANAFKNIHVEMFAGLIIKSDFTDIVRSSNNGILEVAEVKQSKLLAGGQVKVNIQKNTTSVSTQLVYEKVDSISTQLQFVDENLISTKEDVAMIKNLLASNNSLMQLLQDNPFPYFKITKLDFLKSSSQFRINNAITIAIPSKTLQDYVCQILFSGKKEDIHDEWDLDEIIAELKVLMNYSAEVSEITWKKLQEAVANINDKIARKTTKEDIILTPRSETLQLNPIYFS